MKKKLLFSALSLFALLSFAGQFRSNPTVYFYGNSTNITTNVSTVAYAVSSVMVSIPAGMTGTYTLAYVRDSFTNTIYSASVTNSTSLVYLPENNIFLNTNDVLWSTWIAGASNVVCAVVASEIYR